MLVVETATASTGRLWMASGRGVRLRGLSEVGDHAYKSARVAGNSDEPSARDLLRSIWMS
jgi:hypothetical protein